MRLSQRRPSLDRSPRFSCASLSMESESQAANLNVGFFWTYESLSPLKAPVRLPMFTMGR